MEEKVEPVLVEDIRGQWKIAEAYRNNRQTQLLNNGLFVISDSSFMTNILPGEVGPYSYSNNIIKLSEGKQTAYKVVKLQGDTLQMEAEIDNFKFRFLTIKQTES